MSQLWTEKFFPSSLSGFVGNSDVVDQAVKWGEAWTLGKEQKPLLLVGPPGVGKTCLCVLLARHFGWGTFELNGSDFRDKDTIERVVSGAALNAPLFGSRRLVLLDEVDSLSSADRGGAQAILKVLKESKNPVILTANDVYSNQKLSGIRNYCQKIEFKKINYLSISKRLKEILAGEGVLFDEEAVKELSRRSDGDFRGALLDLQTITLSGSVSMESISLLGEREKPEKVFKVMSKIFHAKSFVEVRDAMFYSEISNDLLFLWVEENIPIQFTGNDVSSAFDFLSRADVFNGRIFFRQYFGFMKYSSDLMALGVNSSRTREYHSFTPFRFPAILSKLSRTSGQREMKKNVLKKIGKKIHSSVRKIAVQDMPFFSLVFEDKKSAAVFFSEFGFELEEVAFLLGAKPDSKKALSVFEEAQNIRREKIASKNRKTFLVQVQENNEERQSKLF